MRLGKSKIHKYEVYNDNAKQHDNITIEVR